jgi:3-phenylpropionate/trans-cinnamate dioxygenase ferredoxin subunit
LPASSWLLSSREPGEIIRCPWHGWEFDIRTGQSYCDPKCFRASRAYPVNVEPGANVVKGAI